MIRKAGTVLSAALMLILLLSLGGVASAQPAERQAPNAPPVFTTPLYTPTFETNTPGAAFAVSATDPEGGAVTFTAAFIIPPTPPPPGITATVAAVPPNSANIDIQQGAGGVAPGFYQLTVTATDSGGASASQNWLVIITPSGAASGTPQPSATPTATVTPTPTITPTRTITPTVTPLPTLAIPTSTPIPSATFIPPLPTRTPLPRPANAGQAVPLSGARVQFVANRDGVNVRILPAIGAPLAGIINAGYVGFAEAISGDGEWLRFNFEGNDAWVGFPVISIVGGGDLNSLPVQDPRTIPYGGFENPRAGLTSVTSAIQGRLEMSGLRVRGGPGLGYPVLANAPRYTVFSLLGRNEQATWLQVNFEGTLGWVASQYVQLLTPDAIGGLPVGGIVADALPFSDRTFNSYTDTLSLLLSRIEIATASLEGVRARWTELALGGGLQCGNYPFQPTDYNIPNPVLAAFFGTLDPLQTDFNTAMGLLRRSIQLLIDACEGRRDPAATVQEALDTINQVDALFASMRAELIALIPPPLEFDPNTACLFTFNNRSEVVPRLLVNVVTSVQFNRDNLIDGFCFDGEAGRSYKLEVLAFRGNPQPRVSVSSFDNPTNFISVGSASAERTIIILQPILIPATGRYLVIVSDLEARPLPVEGEIAVLLTDVTTAQFSTTPNLSIDANGNLVVAPVPNAGQIPVLTPGVPGSFITPIVGVTPTGGANAGLCPNVTYTCAQLQSVGGTCNTALACLQAGNASLDPDVDGIPCENVLCVGN